MRIILISGNLKKTIKGTFMVSTCCKLNVFLKKQQNLFLKKMKRQENLPIIAGRGKKEKHLKIILKYPQSILNTNLQYTIAAVFLFGQDFEGFFFISRSNYTIRYLHAEQNLRHNTNEKTRARTKERENLSWTQSKQNYFLQGQRWLTLHLDSIRWDSCD